MHRSFNLCYILLYGCKSNLLLLAAKIYTATKRTDWSLASSVYGFRKHTIVVYTILTSLLS
jgi:hypothetical protein